MSPGFESLLREVTRDYSALWDYKFRGETLEIITPHSTISNKFVSVFLAERSGEFIISDGGYLHLGEYVENEDIEQSQCYSQTLEQLEKYYKVLRVSDSREKLIFFFKTNNRALVTSRIHDMASFITGVVNAQQITLLSNAEAATRTRFSSNANSFLAQAFAGRRVQFSQQLRPNDRIRFSAGIWRGTSVSLIQYVTGSDTYHFGSSLAKATVNFLAVNGSSLAPSVVNKISLVDTTAAGYRNGGHQSYARLLNSTSNIIEWQDKNSLINLIESVPLNNDSLEGF